MIQRGKGFNLLLEPIGFQITSKKEMEMVLRYYHVVVRLDSSVKPVTTKKSRLVDNLGRFDCIGRTKKA